VWVKEGNDDGDVFPGMCFTLAKERMEGSLLWKIVKRFPKGALLHSHLEAMTDSECYPCSH
jgi:adenosine deaminase CECR1